MRLHFLPFYKTEAQTSWYCDVILHSNFGLELRYLGSFPWISTLTCRSLCFSLFLDRKNRLNHQENEHLDIQQSDKSYLKRQQNVFHFEIWVLQPATRGRARCFGSSFSDVVHLYQGLRNNVGLWGQFNITNKPCDHSIRGCTLVQNDVIPEAHSVKEAKHCKRFFGVFFGLTTSAKWFQPFSLIHC